MSPDLTIFQLLKLNILFCYSCFHAAMCIFRLPCPSFSLAPRQNCRCYTLYFSQSVASMQLFCETFAWRCSSGHSFCGYAWLCRTQVMEPTAFMLISESACMPPQTLHAGVQQGLVGESGPERVMRENFWMSCKSWWSMMERTIPSQGGTGCTSVPLKMWVATVMCCKTT